MFKDGYQIVFCHLFCGNRSKTNGTETVSTYSVVSITSLLNALKFNQMKLYFFFLIIKFNNLFH